jgi:hypothetical protein
MKRKMITNNWQAIMNSTCRATPTSISIVNYLLDRRKDELMQLKAEASRRALALNGFSLGEHVHRDANSYVHDRAGTMG